ncbi:MAG: hypothetical protein RQ756_01085 [Flavobacteriaceae bacterium]|nr:hypothetical protein [Flavobacteriaceae bacterium]
MAKQSGLLKVTGTIDGINYYYLNGKPVARKAGGGFNSKAIKTATNMRRVRENAAEFGHCSSVNKAFRGAIRGFYHGRPFRQMHQRLMSLFNALKNLDTESKRGERKVLKGVLSNDGLKQMTSFIFTPMCEPRETLLFDYSLNSIDFVLSLRYMGTVMGKIPNTATHLRLCYGLLDFNFSALEYQLYTAECELIAITDVDIEYVFKPEVGILSGVALPILGVEFLSYQAGMCVSYSSEKSVGFCILEQR